MRLKALLSGADRRLGFASAQQLDPASSEQISANMIGRFLNDGDLRKLQPMLLKKNPSPRSVRTLRKAQSGVRRAPKRRRGLAAP
jgi:hypothetical protein